MTKTPEEIIAEAVRAGIDLELVEHNLTLSPEERARQHDGALRTVLELKRIGEAMRAGNSQAA
jgi:hypothetical protein